MIRKKFFAKSSFDVVIRRNVYIILPPNLYITMNTVITQYFRP